MSEIFLTCCTASSSHLQTITRLLPRSYLQIGLLALLLGVNIGVLHAELEPLPIRLEDLLAEVVIDEGCLERQVVRTVQVGSLFLRRLS